MENFLKSRDMKENYVLGGKKRRKEEERELEEENIMDSEQKPQQVGMVGEGVVKFVYCTPDQEDKDETPLKQLNSKEPLHQQIGEFFFQELKLETKNYSTGPLPSHHSLSPNNPIRDITNLNRRNTENHLFQSITIPPTPPSNSSLPLISPQELSTLLQSPSARQRLLLLDCRFQYEFRGGHIEEAINLENPVEVESLFGGHSDLLGRLEFTGLLKQVHSYLKGCSRRVQAVDYRKIYHQVVSNKTQEQLPLVLVLYCEFSKERSPKMLRFLQKVLDPSSQLIQPLLLEAGYKHFYSNYPHYCTGNYVSMFNKKKESLKLQHQHDYSRNWQIAKAHRSQSFQKS